MAEFEQKVEVALAARLTGDVGADTRRQLGADWGTVVRTSADRRQALEGMLAHT